MIAPSCDIRKLIDEERQCLKEGDAAVRKAYEAHPLASKLFQARTKLIDGVIIRLWKACSLSTRAALIAVGGYGREELYPHSDIDLLFLLPAPPDAPQEAHITDLVGALWDVGLRIGHSVRTPEECLQAAAEDITVQTNLLEARLLTGNKALFGRLHLGFTESLDLRNFFKSKLLEQQQRHNRYQNTPYALEPNCKESPGGLRDLQMLGWIARAAGLGGNWRELARNRLITGDEARDLRNAERLLRHVRIRLHYLTGREEDRLLFDYQERVADALGFRKATAKRASEIMMQRYYLMAKKITQLNTILLQNYAGEIFPEISATPIIINERFQVVRELLDIRHEKVFEETPSAIFECFLIMQQRRELLHMSARTLRALRHGRNLIDQSFREDPGNRQLFLKILQQRHGIVHAFRRMNQYSILSFYLPAWRKIVGQMQHDLFHAYTVDQHILMVLRNIRCFTMGEHGHEYPLITRLILGFDRYWLLYVAALFHDIAKGRGGDHSTLGMDDARVFCEEHGLDDEDTGLVTWLVEHHLTMSIVAQKQDTFDPAVIQRFADIVQTERRLTALYILTHADIRGTGPKVWNGWKAKLLEDLFHSTQRLLRGETAHQALGLDSRQEEARRLLRYYGLQNGVEEKLWEQLDSVYFMRHTAEEIAWHTRMLYFQPTTDKPVVHARIAEREQNLQVMVYTHDQQDLFARVTGFFGRFGFTILSARIHTTLRGYALDSFILQYVDDDTPVRDVIQLIEHELSSRLIEEKPPERPSTGRLSRHAKHFPIIPIVDIYPDDTGACHILSLTAADRPGLLFDVAQILTHNGINLHTAKISTLGERVEDTFLLSGERLSQAAEVVRIEQELLELLQR